MKITYIHHSSFSVELENAVILFDYFKGTLPEFPAGKPLFIFASHFHADHYAPVIFQLGEKRENVFYILSKEIGKKIPEEYRKRYKDRIRLVKAGERIPLDGVITEGHAMLDTAALTGESLPRSVGAGDQVLSGCINMDGSLKVRVERGFGESTVMKLSLIHI